MQIIKDENGDDVEVYTAAELEEQKQAALEEFKTNNPDKTEELEELQKELDKKDAELAKANEKGSNFAKLRAEQKKIEEDIDSKISSAKREVIESVMKDHFNETMKSLAGEDEELRKKIEFNYKRLGDNPVTKDEISSKLRDAYLLASKTSDDGVNNSVFASGGVGKLNIKNNDKKFSQDEKALGAKLGLSAKDFEKFGQ